MFNQKLNISFNRSLGAINLNFPQMDSTLTGWEVPLTLIKITQNVVDGDLSTTETPVQFMGVWQPFSMEQLKALPEGQRSWSHYWVHAKSGSLDLETADKIIFQGNRYKVIEKKDYGLNGFVEYHIIEDFKD